ncbi:MAG: pyridoxal phosphate-dependent aminotransferase [Sedimentisphaerales bacterium]|nr:pyridoxal phosphate-dependent aminotransferase [Sedimentisphaerales bacterium]
MERILADRMRLIDASGIRKVFALAQTMPDAINLSIGQPDFDAPADLKQQAIAAIQAGFNRYSQTKGEPELVARLVELAKLQTGWEDPMVMVTCGVSGGIILALMALVDQGDEVIIPDPYFVIYKHAVNLLGGRCVFVSSYPDFRLPLAAIKDAITDRTKLIIVNSPCNPTGMVYSAEELRALAQIAAQRGITVLSDQIYDSFSYDGPCPCIGPYYQRTIILKGLGKSYGITGWRLGYAVVHPVLRPVFEAMAMVQQYTFVCAPTPFQRAAIAALGLDISCYIEAYKRKRDLICSILSERFELVRPSGAFYVFVKAPGSTGSEFVRKAIQHGVLVIPGGVFSEQDTHFRVSFAAEDRLIERGARILTSLA